MGKNRIGMEFTMINNDIKAVTKAIATVFIPYGVYNIEESRKMERAATAAIAAYKKVTDSNEIKHEDALFEALSNLLDLHKDESQRPAVAYALEVWNDHKLRRQELP